MTTFHERFTEHQEFDRWLRKCVRKYFRHLRDEQVELPNPDYPSWDPSPFRKGWRFEESEFVDDELHITGCEWHMGDYIGGKRAVPIEDFLSFAEHQWELDQFESRLNG